MTKKTSKFMLSMSEYLTSAIIVEESVMGRENVKAWALIEEVPCEFSVRKLASLSRQPTKKKKDGFSGKGGEGRYYLKFFS